METEQEVPRKESQSSLLAKIREPIYQGSARWARPPFVCYSDERGNPVLLIYSEAGVSERYVLTDKSVRKEITLLIREGRVRKERKRYIDIEDATSI